jgi:uncharacterized protein (TIGR04551 family)
VKPAAPGEVEAAAEEEGAEEETSEEEVPKPPVTGKGPRTGGVSPVPGGTGFGPMPLWPQPGSDQKALEKQGDKSPEAAAAKEKNKDEVFAEDWWSHARPIFEIHGYFRVRAELFHNFSLGRVDTPSNAIWPIPIDNHYNAASGTTGGNAYGPALCTGEESPESNSDSDDPHAGQFPCKNKTQAGANMRFRLNPELHISDNLRVMSQIDLLDNLVLGSTPEGYANEPSDTGGYAVINRTGYTPLGAFDTTQNPPTAGQNSYRDSIRVKRVWAEYMTPVGQLRFGRMPSQWGLGILANAGDGPDDDYQSTSDRIMFVSGIKSLDIYFAGAWDFVNEGPTSDTLKLPGAQPYDMGQLDDVDQYVFVAMRRKNPELTKLALAQGQLVLNGGAYVVHRRQILANDQFGGCGANANALGCSQETVGSGYVRRGATAWIPDLWIQLLYKKFRFELEAVTIRGTVENTEVTPQQTNYLNANGENGWKIRQYGIAAEIEQKLVEDRLKLQLMTGWASGDPDTQRADGTNNLSPGLNGLQPQGGDRTISTFRFHPNYKVDLILNRNLLTRVQGVYYFRPSVEYDFVREANGQRFGGGFAGIWTRASQFVQTPGHKRDLGIELDLSLYYQSKDGSLNDNNEKAGGFYTMLQYGVLFPMGGLGYQEEEQRRIQEDLRDSGATDTTTAQILRLYMGVLF